MKRFAKYANKHGFDDAPVSALDRDLVRAYQRAIARARTHAGGAPRPLAPATRTRRLVSLRSFLRFAAREQWLSTDLGATIDLPKLAERLPKPLEDAAREKLHAALGGDSVEDKRDRALILMLLSTGARISEVLRLDRADWAHERVTVRGKGDRERILMVTAKAREAVEDYLAARGDPSPALFISFQPAIRGKRENRLSDEGARYICHQLAKRLGIPPFHPHQAHARHPTAGDRRRRASHGGHPGPCRARVGCWLHEDHTSPPAHGAGRDGAARAIDSTISGQASTFPAHANRHAPRRFLSDSCLILYGTRILSRESSDSARA